MGYYDDHKNAVGVLLTRLATDASQIKGVSMSDSLYVWYSLHFSDYFKWSFHSIVKCMYNRNFSR